MHIVINDNNEYNYIDDIMLELSKLLMIYVIIVNFITCNHVNFNIFHSHTNSLFIEHKHDHMRYLGMEFGSCFWAFGACVQTFQNTCCSMLTVDGTYLFRKYHGVLLVLVQLTVITRCYQLHI